MLPILKICLIWCAAQARAHLLLLLLPLPLPPPSSSVRKLMNNAESKENNILPQLFFWPTFCAAHQSKQVLCKDNIVFLGGEFLWRGTPGERRGECFFVFFCFFFSFFSSASSFFLSNAKRSQRMHRFAQKEKSSAWNAKLMSGTGHDIFDPRWA